jgi:acyl-CoA synthetase (AMP-forming)/AMP-acid ligase II
LMELMPNLKIAQGYGQTELAPIVSTLQPEFHVLGSSNSKLRSAGRAAPGTEIKIVNETGDRVATGEVGEIAARGMGTMQGYWKLEEKTATTLIDGWVHTGDGAYMDEEGFIFIADRIKDMIVTGGENVFSAEVESAISQHPSVAEVAVIGIPDDKWGEAVHSIIVPKEGQTPSLNDIVEHCRPLIANYKLPRSITLRDEPLPLSGAGKVLKRDLRIPYWGGSERQVN